MVKNGMQQNYLVHVNPDSIGMASIVKNHTNVQTEESGIHSINNVSAHKDHIGLDMLVYLFKNVVEASTSIQPFKNALVYQVSNGMESFALSVKMAEYGT